MYVMRCDTSTCLTFSLLSVPNSLVCRFPFTSIIRQLFKPTKQKTFLQSKIFNFNIIFELLLFQNYQMITIFSSMILFLYPFSYFINYSYFFADIATHTISFEIFCKIFIAYFVQRILMSLYHSLFLKKCDSIVFVNFKLYHQLNKLKMIIISDNLAYK